MGAPLHRRGGARACHGRPIGPRARRESALSSWLPARAGNHDGESQVQQAQHDEIRAIEADLQAAMRAGQADAVWRLWERLLARAPDHPAALMALGQRAFQTGDLARARALLQHLVARDGRDKQQWIKLAVVCQAQVDDEGEAAAISGALTLDPHDLLGLILRADLLTRQGKVHAAARAHGAVAAVAPPLARLAPELRPAVERALAVRADYDKAMAAHLDAFLAPHLDDAQGEDLGRFRESVDIMLGRKRRYESQSAVFHYHGLAPQSFFAREAFPWLDEVEAASAAIRAEFLAVYAGDANDPGFSPYLTYAVDQPLNQWAELNQSPRWSAFHLLQDGVPVPANAARCPQTMATLAKAPQPDQAGRTPTAMFSLLKPHTHIPPHTGVSNVRLVTHLPLIVPPDCRFRVGNDTRAWQVDKAWVFDDTIEHEAWNDSDALRVVLIFDIWHPHLNAAERALIGAMARGLSAFADGADSFAL
jgi:aspartate beta-hydroxylase